MAATFVENVVNHMSKGAGVSVLFRNRSFSRLNAANEAKADLFKFGAEL